MRRPACDEIRAWIGRLVDGELEAEEQRAVQEHTATCLDCHAELLLERAITAAADPEPLSELSKRRILASTHATARAETSGLRSRRWLWLVVPAAAAAAFLAVQLWPGTYTGWLTTETPDLRVYAEAAVVASEGTRAEPRYLVSRGTVFAKLERHSSAGPMRVVTPHATVIVRGTVYFVRVNRRESVVGVRRGVVEVAVDAGRPTLVEAGEQVRVGRNGLRREPLEADALARMNHYLPPRKPKPSRRAIEPPPVDAEPVAASDPAPEGRRRRRTASEPPAEPATIDQGRDLMRVGKLDEAIAVLNRVARTAEPAERQEAIYLVASIHRRQGAYAAAAAVLERIATDPPRSSTSRLAALELARLENQRLGDPARARRILEDLVESGGEDAVGELGLFELCALLLEQRALGESRSCLRGFVSRFPSSARRTDAERLERRLDEIGRKVQ